MKTYLKESRYVTALCVWVPDVFSLIEGCRYDGCYPASEVESHKIERLADGTAGPTDHVVRLVRAARTDGPPTRDRWRSFGAYVLDVRHPQDTPPTDVELAVAVDVHVHVPRGVRR